MKQSLLFPFLLMASCVSPRLSLQRHINFVKTLPSIRSKLIASLSVAVAVSVGIDIHAVTAVYYDLAPSGYVETNTLRQTKLHIFPNTFVRSNEDSVSVKGSEASFINGLVSGATTRVAKELILHPIETVKARVQIKDAGNLTATSKVPHASAMNDNIADNSPPIFARYGYSSLYTGLFDGIAPSLIGGIPAGAVFFGTKDFLKSFLKAFGLNKSERTLIAVVIANIPYWLIRNPSEVIKTLDQTGQKNRNKKIKSSAWGKVLEMSSEQGPLHALKILYGSYFSNLLYALPADTIKFLSYEMLNGAVFRAHSADAISAGPKIDGLEAALTGALASLIAQLATTPLDVVRTRVMTGNMTGNGNPVRALVEIQREEGFESLMIGTAPRAVRALVSGAVQFATYEITQNLLQG